MKRNANMPNDFSDVSWCQVPIRPLCVEALAEMLAIRFDEEALPTYWHPAYAEDTLDTIMSIYSSLIAIVDRGGHQVLQSYLLVATTPSPSSFRIILLLLDLPHRSRSHARVRNLLHHNLPRHAR